ncbi:MAG: hypothetical protein M3406_03750, partial [Chloroflexota bacterium]|nr:hypothetical protein [Chloroflexota bacterium]
PNLGLTANRRARRDTTGAEMLLAPSHGSRSTPVYNAHSYHTKVPPEAIEPFIAHHTEPGAVVLDPFAGSGMTGVAASRLGRLAKLSDLSPAAAHIAWNLTHACDPVRFQAAAQGVLAEMARDFDELYGTACWGCGDRATIAYTIWTDRLACPGCAAAVSVWQSATDPATGRVDASFRCPSCRTVIRRRGARRIDSVPASLAVDCGDCGRLSHDATDSEAESGLSFRREDITSWYPTTALRADREMYIRSALGTRGITSLADLYTPRNLAALSLLWKAIGQVEDSRVRQALALAFTNTAWHGTIMRRYNAHGGQRPLTGTLYIPHLSSEVNVGNVFAHKIKQLATFYRTEKGVADVEVAVGSATDLSDVPDRSVDYVFTDPPFGSNIFYADCNLIWESWLGSLTDVRSEAVVNKSLKRAAGGKTLEDYRGLMQASFAEMARVLRRDAWATLVFHSTDAGVWREIEEAARDAGLTVAGATYLDKTQLSHKGYRGRSGTEDVASYDVVLAMRNRRPSSREARAQVAARKDRAISILNAHLSALPLLGSDSDADRKRTLPYLHSLLVQHHFNGDIGLHIGDYEVVRALCIDHFSQDDRGRWLVREAFPSKATVASVLA